MQMLGWGNEEIEVRIPIRKLTEEEKKEYSVRANISNGVWDYEMLGADYGVDELKDWGLSLGDIGEEPEDLTQDLKDNKPQLNITFLSIEDLENAKEEISEILERYTGSFYSVKGGAI